jgi:hypothetical protein
VSVITTYSLRSLCASHWGRQRSAARSNLSCKAFDQCAKIALHAAEFALELGEIVLPAEIALHASEIALHAAEFALELSEFVHRSQK